MARSESEALRALSDEAWALAEGSAESDTRDTAIVYTRLREQASELNLQQGWASSEEFAAMFPNLDQQALIERLDAEIGASSAGTEGGPAARHLLRNLALWAAAVALATEEADRFRP